MTDVYSPTFSDLEWSISGMLGLGRMEPGGGAGRIWLS